MNKIMGYNTGIVDEWENVFELAMIVPGFAYYANYEESDENGNTIVVNDKTKFYRITFLQIMILCKYWSK